jgi:uncharacterized membrane protein YidH (DUF202 family)
MTDSTAPQPPDAGLARERTTLAWNRSGLAVIVCIGVLLRRIWPLEGEAQKLVLGLVAAAAIVWAVVLLVVTAAHSSQGNRVMIGPRVFPLMTAGTLLLAAVAVVLAFVAPA